MTQKFQVLHEGDNELNFCRRLLESLNNDSHFITNIMLCDAYAFSKTGFINTHNLHERRDENPNLIPMKYQTRRWSVNIWAQLLNNNVISPNFLPNRLNSESYFHLTNVNLPLPLLDQHAIRNMHFIVHN